jgi:hypothetical protein
VCAFALREDGTVALKCHRSSKDAEIWTGRGAGAESA